MVSPIWLNLQKIIVDIRSIQDVVDWRLCVGCGACAYICPENRITLKNIVEEGIRPQLGQGDCKDCSICLDVCPSYRNDHTDLLRREGIIPELVEGFGPVLDLWEGYALDPAIRHQGSSGGFLTAMAAFCLEKEGMEGVLHIGSHPGRPLENSTRLSRNRDELLRCSGSRYAPASACDRLGLIEQASAPCVFIGQPSEVSALRKAQRLRPALDSKVGLAMSFFCAGSPASKGTIDLLLSRGIVPEEVAEMRYRGLGWPGMFAVRKKSDSEFLPLMTYQESWGFVQNYRPFAVHVSPDISGEDADLSCGDPWYREIRHDEHGFSLILVRTERGRELLRRAVAAGCIQVKPAKVADALASQRALLRRRGAIWGRLVTMRLLGLPAPKLLGFSLFRSWLALPVSEKAKSFFGTARRIIKKGYRRPRTRS